VSLPKVNRLRQRQDFTIVYKRGIRRHGKHMTLRALRSGQPSHSVATRIGISISQKVSKRAVVRNRIKRRIRSSLRQLLPSMATGWDIVFVVHPQAVECDSLQILQELEQLLMQAEVIHGGD